MTVTINGTTGIAGTNGSAGTPAVQGEDTNTGVFFPAADTVAVTTGGSERLRVDSAGNVGIGVTPSAWKSNYRAGQFGTGGTVAARTDNSGVNFSSNWFEDSGGADRYINTAHATRYLQLSGAHSWFTAPSGTAGNEITFTKAMTLDASGSLLVGTTSTPSGGSGGTALSAESFGRRVLYMSSQTTAASPLAYFFNPNGLVGYITCSGSTTSYVTSSDYRLKENVQPMTGALDKIAQLNPVTYTWKADGSAGQGFIAHELQAVVPDCVTGEKDAVDAEGNPQYQGVDTSFLVATLVKAIQELTARVAELEAK